MHALGERRLGQQIEDLLVVHLQQRNLDLRRTQPSAVSTTDTPPHTGRDNLAYLKLPLSCPFPAQFKQQTQGARIQTRVVGTAFHGVRLSRSGLKQQAKVPFKQSKTG